MVVHQLIPNFTAGDAMAQAAVHFQLLLRRLGHWGEIFAEEISPPLTSLAQPAEKLWSAAYDWVLYHHGISSPLSAMMLHLPGKRGIIYHNISPAHFYQNTAQAEALLGGRAQLAAIAPYTDLAIGVSRFNCFEMKEAGYRNVRKVPLFIEPERFACTFADSDFSKKVQQLQPYILSVSRIVAHKRAEDVIALHRELRRVEKRMNLVFVGSYDAGSRYFRTLQKEARHVGNCHFLGKVSHPQLVAAYHGARAFVSMSEHEGFGLPLLEAIACDLPVAAYSVGAIPEVLGSAGLQFSSKQVGEWVPQVAKVLRDGAFRRKLVVGQTQRLPHFSAATAERALKRALEQPDGVRTLTRRGRRRLHVGVVVQRYGDVSGGAERHARLISEQLSKEYDVTVLTSCARDHLTWANHFPPGLSIEGRVAVHRFPSMATRDMADFNGLSKTVFHKGNDRITEEMWVAEQGPRCPALLQHLSTESHAYDGFVAFTYLYAPVVLGLPMIGRKTLLVPTAHDEPPLQLLIYRDVFQAPRVLLCNTPEEAELIRTRIPKHARIQIAGVGIEPQPAKAERFRSRFGVEAREYLLYVGRIEPGKGIADLLSCYAWARRQLNSPLELLLAGSLEMKISQTGVRYLGRITEQDKLDGITGATAVVVPSSMESLSLLALEAFAQGTPVIANARSPVLSGQIQRSGGGVTFLDNASFLLALQQVQRERSSLAKRGRAFAKLHSWNRVLEIYREELKQILERQ